MKGKEFDRTFSKEFDRVNEKYTWYQKIFRFIFLKVFSLKIKQK